MQIDVQLHQPIHFCWNIAFIAWEQDRSMFSLIYLHTLVCYAKNVLCQYSLNCALTQICARVTEARAPTRCQCVNRLRVLLGLLWRCSNKHIRRSSYLWLSNSHKESCFIVKPYPYSTDDIGRVVADRVDIPIIFHLVRLHLR